MKNKQNKIIIVFILHFETYCCDMRVCFGFGLIAFALKADKILLYKYTTK